jgi:hypothetical protein
MLKQNSDDHWTRSIRTQKTARFLKNAAVFVPIMHLEFDQNLYIVTPKKYPIEIKIITHVKAPKQAKAR